MCCVVQYLPLQPKKTRFFDNIEIVRLILKYLIHDFDYFNYNCHRQTHYGDVPMNLIVLWFKGSLSSF